MKPVYPYIQVIKSEEKEGSLAYTINEKPVVEVKTFYKGGEDSFEISEMGLAIGDKILVNQVDEYPLEGGVLCFVKVKDIVCIM